MTESLHLSDPQQESQANSYPRIKYRGDNNYDTKAASDEATIPADQYGESMTVQSQAEDADINVLMKRYGLTGKMPDDIGERIPTYGDFSGVMDYRSAVEAVNRAQMAFMEIPAELRARWDNDPQKFLEYSSNPENLAEMRKFGLAKPEPQAWKPSPDTQAIIDAVKPKTEDPKTKP